MCAKELQLHNFIKFFAYVNEMLTGMGRNSATPGIGSDVFGPVSYFSLTPPAFRRF